MAKKIGAVVISILIFACVWMLVTGFRYETSAFIHEFWVSESGDEMSFSVGVGSSMGYVRGYKDEGGGVKPHYLKFYSAWGGLNSSIGAKSEYTLQLEPEDTEIYVYHGGKGYKLVLQKNNETGEWFRVK